jgi:hypothetical protein
VLIDRPTVELINFGELEAKLHTGNEGVSHCRRLISQVPNWKGIRQGIFRKQASCQVWGVLFAN